MRVFPELSEQEEETIKYEARERCKSDLHYLAKEVLGYDRITDHYHKQMCVDIDNPKYKFKLLMHPRGHFKSTLATESYGIQIALRNPNARILITNVKLDNSRKFLRSIAQHFKSNPKFRWLWRDWWIKAYASKYDLAAGEDKLDWVTRDVQDELRLLRPGQSREATFSTGATDASMVSQHYGHIIADDLVNRDYIRTQDMVEKSILYFKDLLDLLDPDGEMIIIGTKWSHLDLYTWIIDEFGHKASYSVPIHVRKGSLKDAIERSENTEGKKHWLVSITPTSVEDPIFPEEFSTEILQDLLDAKGPYEFGAQYLLDPTPAEHQKFKEEWLQPYEYDEVKDASWLSTLDVCITVDPAISLDEQACDSAIAVCGYDDYNQMFFLDGVNERMSEDELPEALFDLVMKWQDLSKFVLPVGFESIGFQQLYVYNLQRMMFERNRFFAIEPIARRSMSKDERILRLVPRIKNGFWLPKHLEKQPYSALGKPYNLSDRLKWELLKFPFAGKKDLADALADQLDIVIAHRLPADQRGQSKVVPIREFTHRSLKEDKIRAKRQRADVYNDAVRSDR